MELGLQLIKRRCRVTEEGNYMNLYQGYQLSPDFWKWNLGYFGTKQSFTTGMLNQDSTNSKQYFCQGLI